jgi:hypothetical protein
MEYLQGFVIGLINVNEPIVIEYNVKYGRSGNRSVPDKTDLVELFLAIGQ